MGLDLRGAGGRVCWSYHVAAEIGKFSITAIRKSKQSTLRATVRSADPFKVRQTPLVFEVSNGTLRWSLSDVVITDGILTATIDQ